MTYSIAVSHDSNTKMLINLTKVSKNSNSQLVFGVANLSNSSATTFPPVFNGPHQHP